MALARPSRGSKRNLDVDTALATAESTGVRRRRKNIAINFKMYHDRELIPLLLKGVSPSDAELQIEKGWKLLLMDKDIDKESVDGEWLVYEFAGIVREEVEESMTTASKTMRCNVQGQEDLAEATSFLDQAMSEARSSYASTRLAAQLPAAPKSACIPDDLVEGHRLEAHTLRQPLAEVAFLDNYFHTIMRVEEACTEFAQDLAEDEMELSIWMAEHGQEASLAKPRTKECVAKTRMKWT